MGCGPRIPWRTILAKLGSGDTDSSEPESISQLAIPRIPDECSKCGAPVDSQEVEWVGPLSANCPYCGSELEVKFQKI